MTQEEHLPPSTCSLQHFGTSSSLASPRWAYLLPRQAAASRTFQDEDASFCRRGGRLRVDFRRETPSKPRDHRLRQVADLHSRVQRAIRRAARSSTFTILKRTIAAKEDMFSKRLLEALQIWYAKFPSSKKRGRSLLAGRPPDSVGGGGTDCLL